MRVLKSKECSIVSGGTEIVCTLQNTISSCQVGMVFPEVFLSGISSLYESAVEATTDLFEWMFGDAEENP